MRIYADASVYRGVIAALRRRGLDVRSGAEERASAPDPDVLATATELSRILITEDKDFGDLVVRQGLAACGVILLRTTPTSPKEVEAVAERVIAALPQAEGAITTITEERVRRGPLG